jgi:hypothetical protein
LSAIRGTSARRTRTVPRSTVALALLLARIVLLGLALVLMQPALFPARPLVPPTWAVAALRLRQDLHGPDQALPILGRVPGADAADGAGMGYAREGHGISGVAADGRIPRHDGRSRTSTKR